MAFAKKTGKSWSVFTGNTGKFLKRFSGKDAKKRALAHVTMLHKKHMPKAKNRGKAAAKKFK